MKSFSWFNIDRGGGGHRGPKSRVDLLPRKPPKPAKPGTREWQEWQELLKMETQRLSALESTESSSYSHRHTDLVDPGTYNLRLFDDDGTVNKLGEAQPGVGHTSILLRLLRRLCGLMRLAHPRYMRTCEKWGERL